MTIQLFVIIFLTILNIIIYIKYSHVLTCEGVEDLCSLASPIKKEEPEVKHINKTLSKEKIEVNARDKLIYTKTQRDEIFNISIEILEYDKTVKKEDKLQSSIIISIDKLIELYKEKNFVEFELTLVSLKFILKSVYINNPHLIKLRMLI